MGYLLLDVMDKGGEDKGLYCTNCHNMLSRELYKADHLTDAVLQKGETLRNRTLPEIAGKTHFTARPVNQYADVVKIRITPRQDKKIRDMEVDRQDVLNVRIRFAGLAPGGALAFDLMEILR